MRHGRLVLYVRDGVVTGNVPLGDGVRWKEGRLTVPNACGISRDGVVGKSLWSVLPNDYFDPGATIDGASEFGDNLWLRIKPRSVALRLARMSEAA